MEKIDFEFETQFGVFRDALHLPEGHGLDDLQIAELKQQRLNNWLAVVNPPPAQEQQPAVGE